MSHLTAARHHASQWMPYNIAMDLIERIKAQHKNTQTVTLLCHNTTSSFSHLAFLVYRSHFYNIRTYLFFLPPQIFLLPFFDIRRASDFLLSTRYPQLCHVGRGHTGGAHTGSLMRTHCGSEAHYMRLH